MTPWSNQKVTQLAQVVTEGVGSGWLETPMGKTKSMDVQNTYLLCKILSIGDKRKGRTGLVHVYCDSIVYLKRILEIFILYKL